MLSEPDPIEFLGARNPAEVGYDVDVSPDPRRKRAARTVF